MLPAFEYYRMMLLNNKGIAIKNLVLILLAILMGIALLYGINKIRSGFLQ